MYGLHVLAGKSLREMRNRFRSFSHSRLKVAVVAGFGITFWLGLFGLFDGGFALLKHYPDLIDWVMDYLLALFFFSLTLMLVFSNGIISYTGLFRARETWFLMTQPLEPGQLFLYKLSESVVFSSWAFLFLGTPLMAAFGRVHDVPWTFYALTLLLFTCFVIIPAAFGAGIALLVALCFPRNKKGFYLLLAALGLLLLAVVGSKILEIRGASTPFSALWMKGILERFDFAQRPYLPSYWVARTVITLARGEHEAAAFYFLQILANGLFLCWLGYRAARGCYARAWSLCQSTQPRRKYAGRGWVERALSRGLFFIDVRLRHIVGKDVKTFLRDPVQWSQFLIFFGLLGVYFMNLRTLHYNERAAGFKVMISILNLGATSLTLSTFTSRFVFPQLSLEGRRFWVIGMIPMERSSILAGKFIFSFVGTIFVSETLMLLSTLMLGVDWELALLHATTMLGICLGLSGLAVGLGAMYPSFQEDNPSKIVGGFGGTLNLVVSLLFVVLVIGLEIRPCRLYYTAVELDRGQFLEAIAWTVTSIALLSAVTCAVPLWLGRRALDRAEI